MTDKTYSFNLGNDAVAKIQLTDTHPNPLTYEWMRMTVINEDGRLNTVISAYDNVTGKWDTMSKSVIDDLISTSLLSDETMSLTDGSVFYYTIEVENKAPEMRDVAPTVQLIEHEEVIDDENE